MAIYGKFWYTRHLICLKTISTSSFPHWSSKSFEICLSIIPTEFHHLDVIPPFRCHSNKFHHSNVIPSFWCHSIILYSFEQNFIIRMSFYHSNFILTEFHHSNVIPSFWCHSIIPTSYFNHWVILKAFYHSLFILMSFHNPQFQNHSD